MTKTRGGVKSSLAGSKTGEVSSAFTGSLAGLARFGASPRQNARPQTAGAKHRSELMKKFRWLAAAAAILMASSLVIAGCSDDDDDDDDKGGGSQQATVYKASFTASGVDSGNKKTAFATLRGVDNLDAKIKSISIDMYVPAATVAKIDKAALFCMTPDYAWEGDPEIVIPADKWITRSFTLADTSKCKGKKVGRVGVEINTKANGDTGFFYFKNFKVTKEGDSVVVFDKCDVYFDNADKNEWGKITGCTVAKATDAPEDNEANREQQVVAVTGVTLDKTTASVEVGKTVTLTATVAPANATDKTVTWTSSATDKATVEGGVVTGVAAGEATITATAGGDKTATCVVTVTAAVKDPDITLAKNYDWSSGSQGPFSNFQKAITAGLEDVDLKAGDKVKVVASGKARRATKAIQANFSTTGWTSLADDAVLFAATTASPYALTTGDAGVEFTVKAASNNEAIQFVMYETSAVEDDGEIGVDDWSIDFFVNGTSTKTPPAARDPSLSDIGVDFNSLGTVTVAPSAGWMNGAVKTDAALGKKVLTIDNSAGWQDAVVTFAAPINITNKKIKICVKGSGTTWGTGEHFKVVFASDGTHKNETNFGLTEANHITADYATFTADSTWKSWGDDIQDADMSAIKTMTIYPQQDGATFYVKWIDFVD